MCTCVHLTPQLIHLYSTITRLLSHACATWMNDSIHLFTEINWDNIHDNNYILIKYGDFLKKYVDVSIDKVMCRHELKLMQPKEVGDNMIIIACVLYGILLYSWVKGSRHAVAGNLTQELWLCNGFQNSVAGLQLDNYTMQPHEV